MGRTWSIREAAICLLCALLVCACGGGGGDAETDAGDESPTPAAAAPKTIDSAIAAAVAAGDIDTQSAMAYRVYALFGDTRLPERFRTTADGGDDRDEVDGNAVIDELRAAWDGLAPAAREALAPFRVRPGTAGSWLAPAGGAGERRFAQASDAAALARPTCTANATWAHIAGATAKARVWYDKTRPSDLTQAQAVVAALDTKIWPTLITTLGFKAPLSDLPLACDGGDARLDLYIVAGLGSRGVTIPESTSLRQSSTYVMLRSGLAGSVLSHTLTHQFMYAVMWSYLMAADQPSYGWMRNAMANWAVDAVYPGNATLLADASCLMNSNFLSITSRSTGACSASTSRTRDYGAYLLYQYIGRTSGNTKVRELLAATTTFTTALAAIEANVTGGLRALWPKFAKTLWNQPPVSNTGRPAYLHWDGNTSVPVLAPDHPTPVNANRGSLAEASTSLSDVVANVSTRYYRFTFSDSATRTLMFRNTFYPLYKAGKKVSVQALWRPAGGDWVEENWTAKEWIGFCRDAKAQRLVDLVVIVASGEVGSVTQVDAAVKPTFKRNNIGCWGYGGTAKRTERHDSWSSGSIVVNSTPLFNLQLNPGGTGTQYNDPATGRLRVPIAAPLFRRAGWTLAESYTESGCTYTLNRSATGTSITLGGNAFGSIVINNFAESLPASVRQQQYALLGTVRGAYTANVGSQLFGLIGTVTGPQPDCGTSYASAPGMFVLTNASAGSGPVIRLDGRLVGSFVEGDSTFQWDLAPLREP